MEAAVVQTLTPQDRARQIPRITTAGIPWAQTIEFNGKSKLMTCLGIRLQAELQGDITELRLTARNISQRKRIGFCLHLNS